MWWNISRHPSEELNMPSILQCCLVISPSPSFFHIPPFPSSLFLVPSSISISQASTPSFSFSFCSLAIDAALQPGFTSKPPLPTSRWRSADPQVTFFPPLHVSPSPRSHPQLPWKPGSIKDQWARIGSAPGPLPSPPQALSHPTSCQLHTHHLEPPAPFPPYQPSTTPAEISPSHWQEPSHVFANIAEYKSRWCTVM